MAVAWKCDVCGKDTHVNPPVVQVFETQKIGDKVFDVLKMQKLQTMNFVTGEMEEQNVPVVKDLKPRAHIVKLNAGQQIVQRDFCDECLQSIMPELKALWDKLAAVGSK